MPRRKHPLPDRTKTRLDPYRLPLKTVMAPSGAYFEVSGYNEPPIKGYGVYSKAGLHAVFSNKRTAIEYSRFKLGLPSAHDGRHTRAHNLSWFRYQSRIHSSLF